MGSLESRAGIFVGPAKPSGRSVISARWRPALEYLLLAVGLCLATAVVTWPHARVFTTHVVSHFDPLFSMWRLAWFAHAVAAGKPLLHANIFHPEPYTFLLSDPMFLEDAVAAPAIWSGVPLPLVHNALLLAGIVSSGLAIYWLATVLGVIRPAAVLAALVFALAPYRIEHVMHLELQWIAPAILALGALYRVLYTPQWRHGVFLGLAVWLQFMASAYYAVFLIPILTTLAVTSLLTLPNLRRTIEVGLLGIAVCAALATPSARLYLQQQARLGGRPASDITMFSAEPANYLASPKENVLYGWTADRLGGMEKRLFPGALALTLAAAGLFSQRRRAAVAAAVVTLLSFELSLGVNGVLYPLLLWVWPPLGGLRASARYGVFVLAGISMLASLGCERLARLTDRSTRVSAAMVGVAVIVALVEYRSPLRHLTRMDMHPPLYDFLRHLPESVLLELPLPTTREVTLDFDIDYMFWSTRHWHKLMNGYSGYYPPSYPATLERLQTFPDVSSLAFLKERGVRYIVVHEHYFEKGEVPRLLTAMLGQPELRSVGSFRDWIGPAHLFELK